MIPTAALTQTADVALLQALDNLQPEQTHAALEQGASVKAIHPNSEKPAIAILIDAVNTHVGMNNSGPHVHGIAKRYIQCLCLLVGRGLEIDPQALERMRRGHYVVMTIAKTPEEMKARIALINNTPDPVIRDDKVRIYAVRAAQLDVVGI